MGEGMGQDSRFAKLGTDKKFRSLGKKHKKVKIDSRFQGLFKQEKFVSKCSVDKRGRPKHLSAKEDYEKFYDLDSSEEDDEEGGEGTVEVTPDSSDSDDDSDEEASEDAAAPADLEAVIKAKLRDTAVDYARGEGVLYSSDSSDGDDTSEDDEDEDEAAAEEAEAEADVFDKWGELDRDAETTEDATKRLAVCNMDWDRVGAADIFLALSSFCPPSGSVSSLKIFLSDFGRERLAEEAELGPAELRGRGETEKDEDDDNEEEEDDDEDDEKVEDVQTSNRRMKKAEEAAMARVRQYQVNRLKYYYAVAEFDSVSASDRVYQECDGMEYELSATRFDLRFVPDDMEFPASPTDSCLTAPDPAKYQPKIFQTSALIQQKVELTWDETDPARGKAMKRAFEAAEEEMEEVARGLIASASEDEQQEGDREIGSGSDEDDEAVNDKDMINKYRSLLSDIRKKEEGGKKGNMEITWKDADDVEDDRDDDHEEEEKAEEEELGPWQKYLQKKQDKKKLKKRKEKKKGGDSLVSDDDELPEGVDMDDPFFAEEFGDDTKKKGKNKKEKKKKPKKVDEDETEEQLLPNPDLDLMVMDSDDEKNHFNFKDIVKKETKTGAAKKKWKKKRKEDAVKPVEDNFSVDVEDNRFSALFNRPEYNIDPTESNFKKTKNMEKIIGEKQKRIEKTSAAKFKVTEVESSAKRPKLEAEVSKSLKSVKSQWKQNAKTKKSKVKNI